MGVIKLFLKILSCMEALSEVMNIEVKVICSNSLLYLQWSSALSLLSVCPPCTCTGSSWWDLLLPLSAGR